MSDAVYFENEKLETELEDYPIECSYTENDEYLSGALPHWHFHCEMMCIHEGSRQMIIGDESVMLNAGDIAYIHPQQVHGALNTYEGITRSTLLKFDTSILLSRKIFSMETMFFMPFLPQSSLHCLVFPNAVKLVEPYIEQIIKETENRSYGHEIRTRNQLCSLITALAETLTPMEQAGIAPPFSEKELSYFTELLQYISEHFAEDDLIESALSICHLSYSNFAIKFKRRYGKTFTEYVNLVRISHAQNLLSNTAQSVASVSEQCGFNDACYFSRIFRKMTGISPLGYRQQKDSAGSK